MFKSLKTTIPFYLFIAGTILFLLHEYLDARTRYSYLDEKMMNDVTILGNRLTSHIEIQQLHKIDESQDELTRQISYYTMHNLNIAKIYDENHQMIFMSIAAHSHNIHDKISEKKIIQNVSKTDTPHIEEKGHKVFAYFPLDMPISEGQIRPDRKGVLYLEFDFTEETHIVNEQILHAALINFFIILSLSALLSLILYKIILVRLERLHDTTKKLQKGDYKVSAATGNMDELGQVIKTFNDMTQQISNQIAENQKIQNSLNEGQRIAKFGIWEWDMVSNRLWWSESLYLIFGLPVDGAEVTYDTFEEHIHPDDREKVKKAVENAINYREAYFVQHRIRRSDRLGEYIVEEQGEVEYDAAGNAVFMKGTMKDVTELIATQERLKAYQNSLEEQVQNEISKRREQEAMLIQQSRMAAMGEMIGNIAHQWRQPLNALSLVIGNLEDAYDSDELTDEMVQRGTEKAYTLIDKMSATIDDFRKFFSPEKDIQEFVLKDAVDDAIELVEATLKHHNISIMNNVETDVIIEGHKNELSQVLLNLINNAKDAIMDNTVPDGKILFETTQTEETVILKVSDNAGGIPETVLESIFDPYFTTKEQGKGTGIGLYMSKTIIEEHMNGKLSAKNDDSGAVFTIQLNKKKLKSE